MMLPGIITIIAPILIGFFMGPEALGSYMAGVAVSGVLWAIFQNNAGGAWDNAKKSFEAGVMIDGEMTYKGSEAHKAAVTGDTVGDPFKDTSGPSMNILIKLTCLVGLVIAPILGSGHGTGDAHGAAMHCEKKCEMKKCDKSSAPKCLKMACHKSGVAMENLTKEECMKMCTEMGCSAADIEKCMSNFDANGKFVCKKAGKCCKSDAKHCKKKCETKCEKKCEKK